MANFTNPQSYQAQPNQPDPAVPQAPSSSNLNPLGSPYATAGGYDTTRLIREAVQEKIFDATPAKYKALRLLFDNPIKYVSNDEFIYMEKTFGRNALVSDGAVGGGNTQVITLTAGGTNNITINKVVVYPDNTKGIVTAVDTGNEQITVSRFNGAAGLTAVADGDVFSIGGPVVADGMNFLAHYDRMRKIERFNYLQLMHRDKRWTRMELQKFANGQTTNYMDLDKKEQMDLLLQDLFQFFWNGQRGEVNLSIPNGAGNYVAKTMGGVYPLMQAAGSIEVDNITRVALQPTFESLVFQTDFKSEGGVRYIFAQNALLYQLSKVFKEPGIRYTPNDKIADLNLLEYRFGDLRLVPVATELFKEQSIFPASWANRIFVIDKETIQPVCMEGYMSIEAGQTAPKGQFGSLEDYSEFWLQGMLSLQQNNPLGNFVINCSSVI